MIEVRGRRILIDGRPVVVMAGEIHYFRVARDEWQQRIDLAREIGCTAIASYIPWLFHELPDGTIDVTGTTRPERDVGAFIDQCARSGLQFIARPGPFIMAELKNEGIPYRVYRDHPEIVATGWDGRPVATKTVDYMAPAFLDETRRWYAAILPVLARRLQPAGGNVIAMQLDNEIGMLAWISNTPDLSDDLLADFRRWCADRYPAVRDRYPVAVDDDKAWRRAVESPTESWAGALRVDLARFMRGRFAHYAQALARMATEEDISGIPFLINIHGTEGGSGVPFPIGISQLMETYAGVPGIIAGSDHYLGELRPTMLTDLHFLNACMAAVNDADQPLTSLEFEAGTGDYGGGFERLDDPSTVDFKTRLCLAQGNRLINYYLLAGGINPPLDEPVGDGNDRISFTGERHGTAAPIGPEGQHGVTTAATQRACSAVAVNGRWLADQDEEHDDLAVAFLPDAFATEYHHPGSAEMTAAVTDLAAHRGPGQRRALWHSLLLAGFRFGAVNLQDPRAELPSLVCLASGVYLDEPVQRRLVEFVTAGGRLLQLGPLAQRDLEGRPCSVLADALGLTAGGTVQEDVRTYPSVRATHLGPSIPEIRVGWLQELVPGRSVQRSLIVPLLTDVEGRVCGVEAALGPGRAILLAAGLPALPAFFAALVARLGVAPGLQLTTSVPGVVALTSRSPHGDRLLHLLNPTGYRAKVTVTLDGEALAPDGWLVPERSGHLLALGLWTEWGSIERATSEVLDIREASIDFAPSLDARGHRIVLRTKAGTITSTDPAAVIHRDGELVFVSTQAGDHALFLKIR